MTQGNGGSDSQRDIPVVPENLAPLAAPNVGALEDLTTPSEDISENRREQIAQALETNPELVQTRDIVKILTKSATEKLNEFDISKSRYDQRRVIYSSLEDLNSAARLSSKIMQGTKYEGDILLVKGFIMEDMTKLATNTAVTQEEVLDIQGSIPRYSREIKAILVGYALSQSLN